MEEIIKDITEQEYKYGFTTDVETEVVPPGLNEDIIRLISAKKNEPEWLLEFRLKAFRKWQTMSVPTWAHLDIPEIDFQAISYYAAPKSKIKDPKSEIAEDIDPEIMKTFDKLGIPLEERAALAGNMAVDAVMDSVSVKTTFRETLAEKGIIFCSISEAVREYPELVKKYLGSVVPPTDNFYAALNSAVFTDGSFVYVPKGVRCPMELSTYFRINAGNTGQFERTLLVADEGAYLSYLEGCTARSSCIRMPRSSIPRCKTGIPGIRTVREVSIISLPSAVSPMRTRASVGRRWRPVRPSRGSTPLVSYAAITLRRSFTRWR